MSVPFYEDEELLSFEEWQNRYLKLSALLINEISEKTNIKFIPEGAHFWDFKDIINL